MATRNTSALDNYTIPDIDKVVQPFINGLRVTRVDLSRLTAPGENFLSLVFKADLEVVDSDGKIEKISAVAKRLPIGQKKESLGFNAGAMLNEITWYSKMVPIFKDFAKEYGVDTDYFPTYLGSRVSLNPESQEVDSEAVLLVKNLNPEGFVNADRRLGFDLVTAKSILKSLAAFHATGFGLKYKRPEKFQFVKNFLENSALKPPAPKEGAGGPPPGPPYDLILEKLISLPEFQSYRAQLQHLKDHKPSQADMFSGGGLEPYTTVVHADFWVNNILVTKSEPVKVKILDFQACQFSPFLRDVTFFLLTSLSDHLLREHLDDLLKFYYEQLTAVLDKIGVSEFKLSFQDYMEEVNRIVTQYEILHILFFTIIIFAPKNDNGLDHLTGEIDMFEQITKVVDQLDERQIERLGLVVEICASKGWL